MSIGRVRTHSITYTLNGREWSPLALEEILRAMIQDGVSDRAVLRFDGKMRQVTAEWLEDVPSEFQDENPE
jgi:hypothetical protein